MFGALLVFPTRTGHAILGRGAMDGQFRRMIETPSAPPKLADDPRFATNAGANTGHRDVLAQITHPGPHPAAYTR